jgi:hypothetical protein
VAEADEPATSRVLFVTPRDNETEGHGARRSGLWPLAMALLVGAAVGFAGGYGFGSRDRSPAGAPIVAVPVATDGGTSRIQDAGESNAPPAAAETGTTGRPQAALPSSVPAPRAPTARSLPAAAGATESTGGLTIKSTPDGAQVSVNGRSYGRTPVTLRDLKRGSHRIRIERDGYSAQERRVVVNGSEPQSLTVTLRARPAASTARASLPSAPAVRYTGTMNVQSRPSGARIFVGGQRVGTTPVALTDVPVGEHVVRLEHDGYRRWTATVRVMSGETSRVTASLER